MSGYMVFRLLARGLLAHLRGQRQRRFIPAQDSNPSQDASFFDENESEFRNPWAQPERIGLTTVESGVAYEMRCAEILRRVGWEASMTKGSGDQGVDIIASKNGVNIAIQCKFYNKPVGNRAVQEAYASKSFAKAQFAAVVTNSIYTKSALILAQSTGVYLLNHSDLNNADHIFNAPNRQTAIRCCPSCSAQLRLRANSRGTVACPRCHIKFQTAT